MQRQLSAQEREILRLHGKGLAPSEIAQRLGISETTVAWIVSTIVSDWGASRTDELARALAVSQRGRFAAQFALPLGVMLVLTLATAAALAATGTLHGPRIAPSARASASTTFAPQDPARMTGGPSITPVPIAPPAADGGPTALPTTAPVPPTAAPTQVPTLAPVLPTTVPTIAPPSLPVPLPPLPTVPPLPTPHALPLSAP